MLENFLYQALDTKFGIILETDNVKVLRARLYKARADLNDPDLSGLQFRPRADKPTQLWLIKGENPNAESDGNTEREAAHSDG